MVVSHRDEICAAMSADFGVHRDPVVPYDDLDEALARINDDERPLGLYEFARDAGVAQDVLRRTSSGGACVNVCAVQGAQPSLGDPADVFLPPYGPTAQAIVDSAFSTPAAPAETPGAGNA